MNEEEKQALEECKILMICLYDYMSIEKARFYCNQYKTILNIIEKQQKEIKELEDEVMKKELLIDGMKEERRIAIEEIQEQYYVSKDKIKEKIKYYHKQREKAETEKINDMYVNYIDCLEELLRG